MQQNQNGIHIKPFFKPNLKPNFSYWIATLQIARKSEEGKSLFKDLSRITLDHVMSGVESVTGFHSQNLFLEKIKTFDERYT